MDSNSEDSERSSFPGVEERLVARSIGRRTEPQGDWLLHDVSLSVAAGERIAIVGPTGSGKTLLLRALALLDRLDEGEVLWWGEPIAAEAVPAFRSRVVYLGQRPALLGETVEDNLRAPLRLAVHRDRAFDRARTLARLAPLDRGASFLTAEARNLSGGERQIVSLLRALQIEPRVLLLDEPTAALDGRTAIAVEALVRDWQTECGAAIVWVGHDEAQVERLDARVVPLRSGRLDGDLARDR